MRADFNTLWTLWHDDLVEWTRTVAPKLLVILILAFVSVRLLGLLSRKVVEVSEKHSPRGVRVQQIRTVAGVVRSLGVFVIVFFTFMWVLNEGFKINIAPLLASAGVVGVAIGFGAQTMVKDWINGFFILIENQFEVGDVIRAAGVAGKVEEVSMRRTTLRDGDGTLHIVPNSSIQIVSNTTRDWSQLTLQVAVDYSEDSDRVIKMLKGLAQEFYSDPRYQELLVAAPEVPGIEAVRGQEVDYLFIVKVRPGQQYDVARELRRRIKACFEENRIKAGLPGQVFFGMPVAAEKAPVK
jgi:small-conductance mechanosensitive channel